jgi:phosphoglycolate phosphatase
VKENTLFIFDLDGTLVNSAPTVLEIINKLRCERRKKPIFLSDIYPHLSSGGSQLIERFVTGGDSVKKTLEHFRALYNEHSLETELLYPGVIEFICTVKKSDSRLAICSNKPTHLVDKVLRRHELSTKFDMVVGSSDVTVCKPDPEGLLKILDYFGQSPTQTVMIGDSKSDQQAAARAEIPFYHHTQGYDDGVEIATVFRRFDYYSDLMRLFDE